MAQITLVEAVNLALQRAMQDDEAVVVLGQDVGVDGGVFRATVGLLERSGDDRPALLEERLINLSAVPEAETADFGGTPPGTWLLERVPWTSAEHRIRAVNADAATAGALGIETGAACLIIDRRTWRLDTPVTWVELTYPGYRQELHGRFTPSLSA